MKSLPYLKKLAAKIDDYFGEKFEWYFEEAPDNTAAVTTGINTVAGPCAMTVYCDGSAILPYIMVAELTESDVFTDEEMFTIYETINKVNMLYGNVVVPVINYEESTMILRGVRWATFQDDLPMFGVDNSPVFQYAVGNIIDFINTVAQDFGKPYLRDLMKMFEDCGGEIKR